MNNLKKLGLTALGTALVTAGSAQAASVSVSAATSLFFGGEDNSNAPNGWSMTDSLTFSASGEMDNGFTISTSLEIDGAGVYDDRSITIDTGEMGVLTFSGSGSSGPVGAWDDLTPSANEESWGTAIVGTADGPTNAAIGTNGFIYDYTVSDAIAIKAAYEPSRGTTQVDSSTEIGVAYTGIDGLTIKAAMGENNNAESVDNTVFSAVYAMGPITVGYQTNESDSGTAAADEDFTAMGISYAVSDDLSVSYGMSTLDYESTTKEDQDSSAISVSFTAGGVAISASHQTTDNTAGTSTADNKGYEVNFSFAF
jgi:outer membrane protein OmpU